MGRNWTNEEIMTLRRLYPDTYTAELVKILGRPKSGIFGKANILGLKKSEAFMKAELKRQGDKLRIVGAASRFPKGHVPPQKGKKANEKTIAALSKYWYPKGHEPHNIRPDHYERVNVEGYIEYRVARGKYVMKHRHIWKEAGRNVPKGYVVGFKDGNRLNCQLDNLHLVHRRDIMAQNSIHRLPEELKDTIRLVTKLKKHIHAKEQD